MTRYFDLYIIPTPIGNIDDITYRAIEVLKDVDIVACEDTRITQKILNHYDIKTKCISYHKYNEKERVNFFLNKLKEGNKIALVSDAGTPMICDPGGVLVEELLKNNYTITSLPGACAVTTFLSQIPRDSEEFTFIGFVPRSEAQIIKLFDDYSMLNVVFYDSPERIIKTLEIIKSIRQNAKIAIGRELSKLFEEVKIGTVSEIIDYFKEGIKGEIVCMVYASKDNPNLDVDLKIKKLKSKGFRDKDISIILSSLFDLNKNDIYKRSLDL